MLASVIGKMESWNQEIRGRYDRAESIIIRNIDAYAKFLTFSSYQVLAIKSSKLDSFVEYFYNNIKLSFIISYFRYFVRKYVSFKLTFMRQNFYRLIYLHIYLFVKFVLLNSYLYSIWVIFLTTPT